MNMRQLLFAIFSMLVGWGTAGMAQAGPTVSFEAGDQPGNFFTCSNTGTSGSGGDPGAPGYIPPGPGCVNTSAGQRSLAIISPGDTVGFPTYGGEASTIHTALSLIWPLKETEEIDPETGKPKFVNPAGMPFKTAIDFHHPQPEAATTVTLTEPGLYVFICDIHVYMFAGVIVDDPATPGHFDLGKKITLVAGPGPGNAPLPFPTFSDLAVRLLRTFFIVTDPTNWKDYTKTSWTPVFPAVPVIVHNAAGNPVEVPDLSAVLSMGTVNLKAKENKPFNPKTAAVGEIWVDTQFELTGGKAKPGTATAINGADWKLTKKVALPDQNMNHPHNMWTDKNQSVIYQTQWFGERLTVFDRKTGAFIRDLNAGPAPSHVMTRANNDQVHVAQNGGNNVRQFDSYADGNINPIDISMTPGLVDNSDIHNATHPHGHWMSANGMKMVTPNENVSTSTVYNFGKNLIDATVGTGAVPIATSMMPDASKYYVANLLGHSISVFNMNNLAAPPKTINLIEKYDAVEGCPSTTHPEKDCSFVGALPIQTPVSPDGTNMVTANTLTATITVVDTETDTVVATLPCDPGCHGVNYGAKALPAGDTNPYGQYYAYVASKFSNVMIVVDPDPNRDGNPSDAAIVGRILLAGKASTVKDDTVIGNPGMGGQGVLPVPNVNNGWVQEWVSGSISGGSPCNTPDCNTWRSQLTRNQKAPYALTPAP